MRPLPNQSFTEPVRGTGRGARMEARWTRGSHRTCNLGPMWVPWEALFRRLGRGEEYIGMCEAPLPEHRVFVFSCLRLRLCGSWHASGKRGRFPASYRGGGISSGVNSAGKFSARIKVAKFSLARFWPLGSLEAPAEGCHTHFRFQVAFPMDFGSGALAGALGPSWQTQFCGHVVAKWCMFGVSFLCVSCVVYCSHSGIWHFKLWGFQGWRNCPLAKSSPPL